MYVTTQDGLAVWFNNKADPSINGTSNGPDLQSPTDTLISFQGVNRVLLPENKSRLLPPSAMPVPGAVGPVLAPAPAPQAPQAPATPPPAPSPAPSNTTGKIPRFLIVGNWTDPPDAWNERYFYDDWVAENPLYIGDVVSEWPSPLTSAPGPGAPIPGRQGAA
jgi:hypothetical protein